MLRVITRLDNTNFTSTNEKRPLVLPSRHQLTQLLIREYHGQAGHHGKR